MRSRHRAGRRRAWHRRASHKGIGSRLQRRRRQEIPHRRDVLGDRGVSGRRLSRRRAVLAAVQPRPVVHQFRPVAPGAYLGGDLRVRRLGAVRHVVLRRAAHLPRAPVRRRSAGELHLLGLPVLHRHGGAVLRDGLQPGPGIRRARVASRPVADRRLGALRAGLHRHGGEAARSRTSTSPTGSTWRSS